MKVLYGIQCTGNGHVSRSKDLVQELKKYVQVDVLTSGGQNDIDLDVPIKYKFKGMSYHFGKNGNIGYFKTLATNNFFRLSREIRKLPVLDYDMIVSDFEPITAWAAKQKGVYSVSLSNQTSLRFDGAPKPGRSFWASKWITESFCPAERHYGFFYNKFNREVFYPPIRSEVASLKPKSGGGILVYLPFYSERVLEKVCANFPDQPFHIFTRNIKTPLVHGNIHFYPIGDIRFLHLLEKCDGVMCSSGFSLTSEAIFLGKKLLTIPMKNQYEQQCNAAFLKKQGAEVMMDISKNSPRIISDWLEHGKPLDIEFQDEKETLIRNILEDYILHSRFFKSV
jgi:uncharacterized protein (TIGR00661 family)